MAAYEIHTVPARTSFPISGEFWKALRRPLPDVVGYGRTKEEAIADLLAKEEEEID